MATSLVLVDFIAVVVSLFVLIFNVIIYKKTAGGSKAYLFWAQAAIFIFSGTLIAFFSSFFTNLNEMELEGYKGFVSIIILSLNLVGYYYVALGAIFLPGELDLIKVDLKKYLNTKKFVFLGIIIWASFITSLLVIIDGTIPVRMFYIPFFALSWICAFYYIMPFYNNVKKYSSYWLCLVLGCLFGFIASLSEILGYIVLDVFSTLAPLFYGVTGILLFIQFYKLGRDLEAF